MPQPLSAMPHQRTKHQKRLDPAGPLVFDIRTLGPGTARTERRTSPAPADLGVEMVRVPAGADLELDVQLEGVTEGVLVTATVTAPLAGECARCLEPFTSETRVRFQELYALAEGVAGPDGYVLDAGLLTWSRRCGTRSCWSCRCRRCARMTARGSARSAGSGLRTPRPVTGTSSAARCGRH